MGAVDMEWWWMLCVGNPVALGGKRCHCVDTVCVAGRASVRQGWVVSLAEIFCHSRARFVIGMHVL